MRLFALFYYDAPILKAFLSHYCQFKTIREIIIQNQNLSIKDSQYLRETVASYIDEYNKKIVILPSQFKKKEKKRGQFTEYTISTIINRILQFMSGESCIWGAMDEVLYYESYEKTHDELVKIEGELDKMDYGSCYTRHYCVYHNDISACGGIPIQKWKEPDWRARIFKSNHPLAHRGSVTHDNSVETFVNGKWLRIIPTNGVRDSHIESQPCKIKSKLKLLHYHTLIRPDLESMDWVFPKRSEITNIGNHPKFYLDRLPLK